MYKQYLDNTEIVTLSFSLQKTGKLVEAESDGVAEPGSSVCLIGGGVLN